VGKSGSLASVIHLHTSHHIMSIFEHENYDLDYQRYLDWKHEQEEEEEEMREYIESEEAQEKADNEAAARYVEEMERERETTGERIVREVVNELSVIHEGEEQEEIMQQVAQITVDGVYRYELMWLPETSEVRVEVDNFRDGEAMHYWYPDDQPILKTLSRLLRLEEKDFKIEGLGIFGEGREDVEALPYEVECFLKSTWHDYASEGYAVQFNVNTQKNEDWRNNHPTRHGLDGTQCDCDTCERTIEHCAEPFHESVEENRLPTVYECLSMPKRVVDAIIRNWVARQPDEDKAVKDAAELSETVRKIAEQV
jgi:hypothetical protein